MEFVETQKGNEGLHMNGYKYLLHRRNANNFKAWRCAKYWSSACKATVTTQGSVLVSENGTHSHPPNATEVLVAKARQRLRHKWRKQQALKAQMATAGSAECREVSKRRTPSSWKHFKRMESLLGTRAALRELDDSQDTLGDEGAEDGETDKSFTVVPMEGIYTEDEAEYIVPTPTDPSLPSTSGTSAADTKSFLRVSDVHSLAGCTSAPETTTLPTIEIKKEVIEESMERESLQQPASPSTATVLTSAAHTFSNYSEPVTQNSPVVPPQTILPGHFATGEPAEVPALVQADSQPTIPAAVPLREPEASLDNNAATGAFSRARKRMATPWTTPSLAERKAKIELEILVAQRRRVEAEMRKFEADERKVVAETLLLTEEMKKFKAEAEFFLQEKARSEEETKKAAAKAALLLEHKNFYLEQQKTEVVRRRMLLFEIRKMKHDLKLLQ